MMYDKRILCLVALLLLIFPVFLSGHQPAYPDFVQGGNPGAIKEASTGSGSGTLIIDTLGMDTMVVQLPEMIVTAFNRSQKLMDVPGSLTYIGSVVLELEKPAYNLLPVLQHAPGVFAHQGATNTNRVTIRGIGARVPYATGKIRAYFNNIPLTNTSGVTFIQDIDPAVIESMEVIKGPATSIYGAGLGGTIAITARQPAARSSGISNTVQAGSYGLFRNSVVADLTGEGRGSSLVYSHTQSDGYRQNNQYRRDALTSVSQFGAGEHTRFTLLMAFSDLKSHIPSSIDSLTFMEHPQRAAANWLRTRGYEDARRLLGGLNMSHRLHQKLFAEVSLFSVWHNEKEMRPFDVFYEERATLGTRFNLRRHWTAGDKQFELSWGGEAFFENYLYSNHENIDGDGVVGDQISDNKERVAHFNFFLQADALVNTWVFSAGANLNHNRLNYQDLFHHDGSDLSGSYNYGVILSPRLSAAFRYSPGHTLFATLSHGFSPPSLSETLTPEGRINPDIRPERSWNMEIGLRGQPFGKRLFYDISFYRMRVQDLLVADRVGEDAWVGKNAGKSVHRGIEAELHWVLWRNRDSRGLTGDELSVRANVAYNHFFFIDFTDLDNDYSGNRIPGVPREVFFSSIHQRLAMGAYATVSWRHVGRMAMNDANTRFYGSYALLDLTLGYQVNLSPRWEADIFLVAHNLLDRHHASMILVNAPSFGPRPRYYYPGLPRHYHAGIRFSFR